MRQAAMAMMTMAALAFMMGCDGKGDGSAAPKADAKKVDAPAKKTDAPAAAPKVEPTAPKFVLRVSAGGEKDYTDQDGKKWLADKEWQAGADWGADGGATVTRGLDTIAGTKAPQVYLTERYSMGAYNFAVPNGKYTLRLHFAETYDGITAAGERVFSINVNGKPAIKNLDVFKEAGGFAKPLIKEVKDVEVTNGKIVIEFVQDTQNPEINGIEVLGQ